MGVPDLGPVIQGDNGLVAVGAVVSHSGHESTGNGLDRVSRVAIEVDPRVVARPQSVVTELCGDLHGVHGQNPEVRGNLHRLRLRLHIELVERGLARFGLLLCLSYQSGVVALVASGATGSPADDCRALG
jgi:hypothetical protein